MLYKNFDDAEVPLEYTRTSKGNQPKWREGKYWFKQDMLGYEALSEVLISTLLRRSNMEYHVGYELVMIRYNQRTLPGCYSRDFKKADEELFTLERLHLAYTGEGFGESIKHIKEIKSRIEYTASFVEKHTGITDAGKTITKWLEADAFFLNEDRHTNNIAFLRSETSGEWGFCPYYDNGLALLSDVNEYPLGGRISDLVSAVTAKPFSGSFNKQVKAAQSLFGRQLRFAFTEDDVRDALMSFDELYDQRTISRVSDLIRVQSNRYKELFDE